ncbi:ABC transporter ATP-binding protein [Latilactobacillus curvatus]|uniref:ABC transporter ATP-binding protein n=1 Tax=Latilactobacillus curvatus TaxID=28038 RepID=UPI000FECAE54|nr:ABC transporter ATP-binding protein [Latilactobacillus curvatus]QAR35917.1 ABC transporter ATP-binding protein [Latilactobacillus curvatus]
MIEIKQVTMQFEQQVVLNQVDLSVQPGEIVGLVGANGAGKSTLINLILGRLQPTAGEIRILGQKPTEKEHFNLLGAMMQGNVRLARVSVIEELELVCSYYQQPRSVAELLTLADLKAQAHKMVSQLSGGQLRRLSFALAMTGNPDLLFLDEPTVGMDVGSRQKFWQQIEQLKEAGKTIIVTSHYLEEIEHIATRILLLKDGQFQFDGDLATLQQQFKGTQIRFTTDLPADTFAKWPGVIRVTKTGANVLLQVTKSDPILGQLAPMMDTQIHNVQVQASSLNAIYSEMMED